MLLTFLFALLILAGAYSLRLHFYSWYIGFPPAKYRVLFEWNLSIPMTDGVKLATDIYRPNAPGKFPVLIARTPYSRKGSVHPYKKLGQIYASHGFVFIVQDVRGKFDSEGEFLPYAHEAEDGHTAVNWAGAAKWSNGKVALFGFSYLGSCAWLASKYQSPYLKAIVPMFTTQNCYSIWSDQGIPFLKGPLYWLSRYSVKNEDKKITLKKTVRALWKLPLVELDTHLSQKKIPVYQDFLSNPIPGSFWDKLSVHHLINRIDVPAFIVGGWYDPYLEGTLEDFLRMQRSFSPKNRSSHLFIGPWAHNPLQKFKGVDFGKEADFNKLLLTNLRWCHSQLNEQKIPKLATLNYFVMGKNVWKSAEEWPPKNVKFQKFFLHHDKKGLFLSKTLNAAHREVSYLYDPLKPVPFRGSHLLHSGFWTGPVEQNEFERRSDILTYHTAPFEEDLTIAGPIKLILFVSSTAVDTDFFAKISDKRPNGKAYNLQNGTLRMRFRNSYTNPTLLNPGEIYRIEINLKSIANTFLKGHSLQLQITSSDFPTYSRNLNTGLNCEKSQKTKIAHQTIFAGAVFDSHLLLPVIDP